MNNDSRTQNSMRNMLVGLGGQFLGVILSFISRTIFIAVLGAEYLGISGLFSNILSVLSLAELGVGSAITYNLYKPLAEKDEKKINALMRLYRVAYQIIGCTVAVAGLALIPFLEYIIKDKPDIPDLTLIYLLFLTNSVVSYFFAYKSAIIIADQKQYLTAIYAYGFNLVQNSIQIALLLFMKSYLLYLLVQVMCGFLNNFFIAKHADKRYPFLKNCKKENLDKEDQTKLFKNIGAMMLHKIGGVAVLGLDNILISMYVGLYWVGLYSNYVLIIGIVNNFLNQIFSSITASIGHLTASETKEKAYGIFTIAFFINFWIYSFCVVAFWVLFNPFLIMWIGSEYAMSRDIVLLVVINFYLAGMRRIVLTYRDTMGLFWHDRYKPLFEAAINFSASLILVQDSGIAGVLLGGCISTLSTCFWVEPYILYKYGFKKNLPIYFIKYAKYAGITIVAALVTDWACSVFTTYSFGAFIGRAAFCLLIPNIIIALVFFRTSEFIYVFKTLREMTAQCLKLVNYKSV